jgi:TctA family transporter
MLSFGVPGNVITAILLGAFLIMGIEPGPDMLTTHLQLTFSMVWLVVIANIIAVPLCILLLKYLVKLTQVRANLLIPPVLLMVLLGGFAESNSFFGVIVVLIFGLLGIVMVELDWPRPPLVLGLVLGTLIERYFFISFERYGAAFLGRPVLVAIFVAAALVLLVPLWRRMLPGRKRAEEVDA